jgi:hypothetical protein
MDVLAHCRAMAAFCRQRATFENENDAFWIREATEWDKLIYEYTSPQFQIQTVRAARSWGTLADMRHGTQCVPPAEAGK